MRILSRASLPPLLAAWAFLASGCRDLHVIPAGCEAVIAGGICEAGKDAQLRLFVETDSPTVTVWQGLRPLPLQRALVQDGTLLRFTVRPGVQALRVLERSAWRVRSHVLSVRETQTEEWIAAARKLWEDDHVAEAAQLLQSRLGAAPTLRSRAEALGMLGRIRREQLRGDEAKQLLEQALEVDREAGLLSNEAKDTLALAALLVQDEHRIQSAEALLSSRKAIFEQVPDLQPWVALHTATYRKLRGDLQGALEAVESGRQLAVQLGEEQGLGALRQSSATILQALGRWDEAREELLGLAEQRSGQPCLQANALEMQGWLEIVARETMRSDATKHDPRVPLEEALRLRRDRCNQGRPIASTLTNLARAALAMGQIEEAQSWLKQARQLLADPEPDLKEEWAELSGSIALQQSNTAVAARSFQELLDLSHAHRQQTPAKSAERDLYDAEWRALIGLGRTAHKAQQRVAAEEYFRKADAFLDARSLELPLSEGRVSYLGRHEQGTAAYLELLYEEQRFTDALELIRRARARGLRTLLRLESMTRLSDEQRQSWEAALRKYHELRGQLDANAVQLANAVSSEMKIYQEKQRQLELALSRALDSALAVLSAQGPMQGGQSLRAPAAEEVLLACHPLTKDKDWLCLAARGSEPVQAVRLSEQSLMQGNALIARFGDQLKRSGRLTVLLYGDAMKDLDFSRLQLEGRPLESWMSVVYGLDLSLAPAPEAPRKVALLAVDPANAVPVEPPKLAAELAQQPGWEIREVPSRPGTASEQLLGMLSGSELFVYFGHARVGSQVSRRYLQTDANSGLQATDILTLRAAPREVILIACESGLAKEASGGVAGLGLAQSFLLRGSRYVIATTREVDARLGKAMIEELLRGDLDKLQSDPARRLSDVRRAVEQKAAQEQLRVHDGSAFRVFVP